MKKMKIIPLVINLLVFYCFSLHKTFSQCKPFIIIDGNAIIADENDPNGLRLPTWLTAGQTLNIGQYVYSISVIEFTVNGTALDYSANLRITSSSTVPSGPPAKVWKIEAVHKNVAIPSFAGTYSYSIPGTFTFVSPPCSLMANIRVYGGGGGGAGSSTTCSTSGAGGGGAGYAEGYYLLTPSTSYTVVVGAAGNGGSAGGNGSAGGSSSVSVVSISATAGGGGTINLCGTGTGGTAGTGSGQLNFTGQAGFANSGTTGGDGGGSGNSGAAGSGGSGADGTASSAGTKGTAGRVEIIIGNSYASSSSVSGSPCATMYLYNNTGCSSVASCPSGWTDGGCGYFDPGGSYCRTCYKCN